MTSEERRVFVRRGAWMIVPGLLSGALTAGAAVATIQTQITHLQKEVDEVKENVRENSDVLIQHRVYEHDTIRPRVHGR